MQLITNDSAGHRAAIRDVFKAAHEVFVAVAFLKKEGATYLCRELGPLLKSEGRARIFIGTDFYLTEPDALQSLLDLAEAHDALDVFLGARKSSTFHPKTYAGFSRAGLRCLVGSANLTGGALGSNIETSLRVDAADPSPLADQLREMAVGLQKSPRFELLTRQALIRYRSSWKPVELARKAFEAEMEAADELPLDADLLGGLYQEYRKDNAAQAELAKRRPTRTEARGVQRKIAALHEAGLSSEVRSQLESHLQDLMSGNGGRHLWPSDNIFRKAGEGLKHPRKMIDLFREAERAAKLSPAEGYAVVWEIAVQIPGVGINLVSEVLSTYAPKRFAVVNKNTVSALAKLGMRFKGSSSLYLPTIKPERYAVILGLIASVRDRIGAADFPETDAFLNWIFQKKVRRTD
ncbi:hypothetical protein [Brevundimonas sp. M20]|uniref:hypothetical protein n=1 Tax=Brevundimonas sp. M20 TaxID=2591463 RepID=UPI0011469C3F|nr:hypothetical protein [Brevundimonas sp. M20]QDH74827.1 hypothetical protein FKQ52_16225 [Brevundimonas sp. M20]